MNEQARFGNWIPGLLACASVLTAGCATSGTAAGALVEAGARPEAVAFDWEESRLIPSQGDIHASFPDGRRYQGTYSQVTHRYLDDEGEPDWFVGDRPVYDEDWIAHDLVRWREEPTARVVANLESDEGDTLRCRFTLAEPSEGMAGGGSGECTTEGGERITGVVLGARPERQASVEPRPPS